MNFIPINKGAELVQLTNYSSKKLSCSSDPLYANDLLLLQPEESFAFAFKCLNYNNQLVGRIIGYPVIKWCNTMGETSYFRGDDTQIKSSLIPTALLPQPIKFLLLSAPSEVKVYEEFKMSIRLSNTTSYAWPIRLECPNYITTIHSENAIMNHAADDDEMNEQQTSQLQQQQQQQYQNNYISNSPVSSVPNPLLFTGITSTDLGSLHSNEYTDVTISLCGTSEGLYEVPQIYAIHSLTKEKYSSGILCKVLVLDDLVSNELPLD
jgi:hypothetical protein